jgi:hypothetical protein
MPNEAMHRMVHGEAKHLFFIDQSEILRPPYGGLRMTQPLCNHLLLIQLKPSVFLYMCQEAAIV